AEAFQPLQKVALFELLDDVRRPMPQDWRGESLAAKFTPDARLVHAGQESLFLRDRDEVPMVQTRPVLVDPVPVLFLVELLVVEYVLGVDAECRFAVTV